MLTGGGSARGKLVHWLEKEWQTREPILTASGTMALSLAMKAIQGENRSGVALPAYGCYDLVTAALGAQVPVRWYDVDPGTLSPEWGSLERVLSAPGRVGGIVIVHHYGIPVDLGRVRLLAERFGGLIIEDAAQGIGGRLEDLPLGARGDLAVLSFGRGKGLTGGGGGALLVNTDRGRHAFARLGETLGHPNGGLKSLVTTTAQWLLAHPSTYALPSALPFLQLGETVFREPEPLRGISPTALGILAATMDQVEGEAKIRRRNAAWLLERLGDTQPVRTGKGLPGYLRLPLMLTGARRAAMGEGKAGVLGITPGYPRVLNRLPASTASDEQFAGAEELVGSLVTVPVHSRISETDRKEILDWLTVQ
jgi:dTDP-4-amino-4,6-dideoxygalactose transaminase